MKIRSFVNWRVVSLIAGGILVAIFRWWWCWWWPATTVIILRHAEKSGDGLDDPLHDDGFERANELISVAGASGASATYASQALRTQQTVQPLADHLGVAVEVEADMDVLASRIRGEHRGDVVVVAGHSNTTVDLIELLVPGWPCPDDFDVHPTFGCLIPDDEYHHLFVLTLFRFGPARIIHAAYGDSGPWAPS